MGSNRTTALYGQLHIFSLNTILSTLNLQKVTGRLTIALFDQVSEVLVKNGEVVDAWSQTERGLNALLPLFALDDGVFSFNPQAVETRTINISLPILQVRSAVYLEELKAIKRKPVSGFSTEIPSANHILVVNPSPPGEVIIKTEYWKVLRFLLIEPQSLLDVSELTSLSLESLMPVATEMARNKMVLVNAPGSK